MANDPNEPIPLIRGLRLPASFVALWKSGKWNQPNEEGIKSLMPWLKGSIEFIENMQWMELENRTDLVDDPQSASLFREYRGSKSEEKPDLPWLDVEKSLVIAVNRISGDDLAIALDFRTSDDDPRVVASYWRGDGHDCHVEWRIVTETFSKFLSELGMTSSAR